MHRILRGRPIRLLLLLILFLGASLPAQQAGEGVPSERLPQDSGVAGLKQMLLRLHTTARLMHTTAHPDDEDGGMMVLESRGKGASVQLLTLNRGEGGQNRMGSNLFDELGVLRTLELLASDQYYGVEQRFTRVADFGFSKSADETFAKWHGHDTALADVVRVIRTFRPDVLVSRFQGTARDGHGHHEAAGTLSREAFRAAADPSRFPEQIREGLQPWQAKKLYVDNVRGTEDYSLQLDTGAQAAALGMSYVQFALQGLRHQLSQGAGGWRISAGPHFSYYKLVDSVLPHTSGGHEQDFFDGIDTSLPGLADKIGAEQAKTSFLRPTLVEIEKQVNEATAAADQQPASAAMPLLAGLGTIRRLVEQVNQSALSAAANTELLANLHTKQRQFEEAAALALNLELRVTADSTQGAMIVPGQTVAMTAELRNSGQQAVEVRSLDLDLPTGWRCSASRTTTKVLNPGENVSVKFQVSVPPNAEYTRPYWHRSDPETQTTYSLDDPQYLTLPFPPPPVKAHASYVLNGREGWIRATAAAGSGEQGRPLAVVPAFSVLLDPVTQVVPASRQAPAAVTVDVRSYVAGRASLRLQVPSGWKAEPAAMPVSFESAGEHKTFSFQLAPRDGYREGRYEIKAVLEHGGKEYAQGFSVVTREDLGTFYYYQPAVQRVRVVDVKLPTGLKVGYIMGAGDDIPTTLKQLGLDVELISADELARGDLSRFGTIILGIRAYDTHPEVRENNPRLLDFVAQGGTLLVQYNSGLADFNAGHFTPYPAQLSRERVTVEEAPVRILAPEDSMLRFPNQISERDFEGWVQERGLYFMDQWDGHFQPLLSCSDPGEPPREGGLLRARYGKGTYLYTGYAFFRQLPNGVPGAIRLYVNLLSAGHEQR